MFFLMKIMISSVNILSFILRYNFLELNFANKLGILKWSHIKFQYFILLLNSTLKVRYFHCLISDVTWACFFRLNFNFLKTQFVWKRRESVRMTDSRLITRVRCRTYVRQSMSNRSLVNLFTHEEEWKTDYLNALPPFWCRLERASWRFIM